MKYDILDRFDAFARVVHECATHYSRSPNTSKKDVVKLRKIISKACKAWRMVDDFDGSKPFAQAFELFDAFQSLRLAIANYNWNGFEEFVMIDDSWK